MPNTKPDLFFDDEGVCIACRSTEYKHTTIDWKVRKKELETLLNQHRLQDPKKYDCIIPVSGGKDSTYQVFIVKNVYKLKPLCVHFEPTNPSEIGRRNLENLRRMGVDVVSFKQNPVVYEKICREAFVRVGDYEWPNHVGIFTVPIRIAVNFNIPLVIWGENSQLEYGGPKEASEKHTLARSWLEEFGGLLGLRVSDLTEIGLSETDLTPYYYPSTDELKKANIQGIFLGYYLKWDARRQVEIVKKLGFNLRDTPVDGTYVTYENLDEGLYPIHDYFKYLKFGFSRATDHASLDIRHGNRLTRRDAFRLVAKYDDTLREEIVDAFCKKFKFTKEVFYDVIEKFANKSIFKVTEKGKLIWHNGKLINVPLENELVKQGITASEREDVSDVLEKIEQNLKKQVEKEGYVTELIQKDDLAKWL